MKKTKILFLSPLPPPNYGSAMSSEMCLEILRESKNFEVRNIKINYSKEMSDIGINKSKIKGFFEVKNRIKKEMWEFAPDLVYFVPATSHKGLIRDFLLIKEVKKHGGKILFHIRTRITNKDWKNPFYNRLYKSMFKGESAIVLDKSLKKDLRGLIEDKDVFILPNAIKNEVSENECKKLMKKRQKKKDFDILFLSNMDESKGWLKILQACKIMDEKELKFNCNFVGAWQGEKEQKKFYSFVKNNNLQEKVKYLGKKIGKEKNEILGNSDTLVFPTEYKLETFGLVVIEGMMFELPVIANGIAAIPTTIKNNKTGFVLKENSPEEISEKIEILLKDKKLREKMGKDGRKRFLKFYTLDTYKKGFLKILGKG